MPKPEAIYFFTSASYASCFLTDPVTAGKLFFRKMHFLDIFPE